MNNKKGCLLILATIFVLYKIILPSKVLTGLLGLAIMAGVVYFVKKEYFTNRTANFYHSGSEIKPHIRKKIVTRKTYSPDYDRLEAFEQQDVLYVTSGEPFGSSVVIEYRRLPQEVAPEDFSDIPKDTILVHHSEDKHQLIAFFGKGSFHRVPFDYYRGDDFPLEKMWVRPYGPVFQRWMLIPFTFHGLEADPRLFIAVEGMTERIFDTYKEAMYDIGLLNRDQDTCIFIDINRFDTGMGILYQVLDKEQSIIYTKNFFLPGNYTFESLENGVSV